MGVDTIGGTTSDSTGLTARVWTAQVTASVDGTLQTLGVNVKAGGSSVNQLRIKLYADSGGAPGALLSESGSVGTVNGWNDVAPGTLPAIVGGTKYWIAVEVNSDTLDIYYQILSGALNITHTYGAGPDPYGSGSATSVTMNMRITYIDTIHVNVSDSGSGIEVLASSATLGLSDSGAGIEGIVAGILQPFFDSGFGQENFYVILPPPLNIQGLVLPHVLLIRRISSVALGPKPTPGRGFEYVRQLGSNGDTWEVGGLVDRVTLEQFFALQNAGAVWVKDPDRGNFHAIIEVEATWVADDAPELEKT